MSQAWVMEDLPHKHAAAVTIQKKSRQRAARKKVAILRQSMNEPISFVEPVSHEEQRNAQQDELEQSLDSLQQDEPVGFAVADPEEQPNPDMSVATQNEDAIDVPNVSVIADSKAQLCEAEPALDDIVYDDEQKAVALMIQKRARKRQSKAKEAAKGSTAGSAAATVLPPTIETEPAATVAATVAAIDDSMISPASTRLPSGTSTEVSLTDTADDAPPSPCDNTLGAVEIVLDSAAVLDSSIDGTAYVAAAAAVPAAATEQSECDIEAASEIFSCDETAAAAAATATTEHAAAN
eukprot:5401-Heterococcus_DN1.PRE.2